HPKRVRTMAVPTRAAAFFPKQNRRGSNDSMYDWPGARSRPRRSGKPEGRRASGAEHLYVSGFFFGFLGSIIGTSMSNDRRRISAGMRMARSSSLSMRMVHGSRGPGAMSHRRAGASGGGGGGGSLGSGPFFGAAGALGAEVGGGAA